MRWKSVLTILKEGSLRPVGEAWHAGRGRQTQMGTAAPGAAQRPSGFAGEKCCILQGLGQEEMKKRQPCGQKASQVILNRETSALQTQCVYYMEVTGRQGYCIEISKEEGFMAHRWIEGTGLGHLSRSSLCRGAVLRL